jgi:hypothetical protein
LAGASTVWEPTLKLKPWTYWLLNDCQILKRWKKD